MEELQLEAEVRQTGKGEVHALRRSGLLPVVLYGHDAKNLALSVVQKDVDRILGSAAGKNALVRLRVKGEKAKSPHLVMIKEIQRHPVKRSLLHLDLYQVSLTEKIHARIPIQVLGGDAVEKQGFIVQHVLREVEVECLPAHIPDHLTVDISGLSPGDHVSVGDVATAEGVRFLSDQAEVVVAVAAPRAIEEAPAAPEAAEAAPAEGAPAPEEAAKEGQ